MATSCVTKNLPDTASADNTTAYGVISDYFGGGDLEEDLDVLTLFNELARVINVQLQTIHVNLVLLFISDMHNTDTSIEESKVPDKEDAVHRHVSDISRVSSERPATSIISEYEVPLLRDVEVTVTAVPDIVCNNWLDIADMVVEHNETEERIAWFLEGTCTSCYIAHYAPLSL